MRLYLFLPAFFTLFSSLLLQAPCYSGEIIKDIFAIPLAQGQTFSRIISLYPAHTENLASLGALDQMIGISTGDDYPQTVLHKQRFSYRDNPEKFIAANPDLVLVRPMIVNAYKPLLEKLNSAGITIVSLQPKSIEQIYTYWQTLGSLTDKEKAAIKMVKEFKRELQKRQEKTATVALARRPGVYFQSIHSKMKTFAPQSIAIFVLESSGGRNIAADAKARRGTNIAAYGKERILSHAEEIDIFLAQQGRMNPVTKKIIRQEPGFAAIKAVRQEKIHLIDEKLVSRPTMRLLRGISRLRTLLYPKSD